MMALRNACRSSYPSFPLFAALFFICMVFALPGFGASPFSSLPANHWSYQSIERLFTAGLVEVDAGSLERVGYNVSRYEMAVWVAEALGKLQWSAGEQAGQALELETLVAGYNQRSAKGQPRISADDMRALADLVSFLRAELEGLGYVLSPIPQKGVAPARVAGTPVAGDMLAIGVPGAGVLKVGPATQVLGGAHLLPGSAPGTVAFPGRSLTGDSPVAGGGGSNTAGGGVGVGAGQAGLGLGLALELGDVLVTAGRSASAGGGDVASTKALGLNWRLQNVNIQVGFTAQGPAAQMDAAAGTRRIASAGVEYMVAPTSKASAGFSFSDDTGTQTTSTGIGLRYNQKDAAVTLGYSLVDVPAAALGSEQEKRANVATAEFSIRF
jgi:hypothetical protein